MSLVRGFALILRGLVRGRAALALENLVLRQQLAVLRRSVKRPRLRPRDRLFWVLLRRYRTDCRSHLILVKPETVVGWHQRGFKLFWRWKSRRGGRPRILREVIDLIHRMARENPTWGAPRIRSELRLLGYEVADSTVARYIPRRPRRPSSQTWRTFLRNHLRCTAACDFFVVPAVTFRLLYRFVILSHKRRHIVHFNVTPHPSAEWTAQQIVEAFPGDGTEPRFLLRDRDSIYGAFFRRRVRNIGIEEVITTRRSPWQNPYVEGKRRCHPSGRRAASSVRSRCLSRLSCGLKQATSQGLLCLQGSTAGPLRRARTLHAPSNVEPGWEATPRPTEAPPKMRQMEFSGRTGRLAGEALARELVLPIHDGYHSLPLHLPGTPTRGVLPDDPELQRGGCA